MLNAYFKTHSTQKRVLVTLALLLPVFIYGGGLLLSRNKLPPGDGDYYIQLYEAARRSILEFHQIPFWNPWVSGGIPLFANPQYGPISIQALTTLIFGSVFGYKLALVIYLAIGFLGLRYLLIKTYLSDKLIATLLAYIWVFSSFFVYRSAGHYTFFVIAYLPWMLHFFINRSVRKNWLWFALFSSALIWSSMHYSTILSFFIIGLFGIQEAVGYIYSHYSKRKNIKSFLYGAVEKLSVKKILYSGVIILLLTFPKIYATMEYSYDYPRVEANTNEAGAGAYKTLYALFAPDQYDKTPTGIIWGWHEYSTYIGILTGFAFLISIYVFFSDKKYRKQPEIWLLVLIVFCLALAQGDFAKWAPFTLFRDLPVFSSMRVASRWINWASIFILVFIGAIIPKKKSVKKPVAILLLITVIELFSVGSRRLNDAYILNIQRQDRSSTFTQRVEWHQKRDGIPYDENFTEATQDNIGQIIAGDSLIDTRSPVKTIRCDESKEGCTFISKNATLLSWSPNKIVIKRTGEGRIYINMNPGSRWQINGVRTFKDLKVVDPSKEFIVDDPSEVINITYYAGLDLSALLKK